MNRKSAQLESLKKQEARIKAQILEIEARTKIESRKQDTRLKVIVGAACLADAVLHPETAQLIRNILARAITAGRDQNFLKSKGWGVTERAGQ